MSVVLRIVFVLAGLIAALIVSREGVQFEMIQTWISLALVLVVVAAGSIWMLRRRS